MSARCGVPSCRSGQLYTLKNTIKRDKSNGETLLRVA